MTVNVTLVMKVMAKLALISMNAELTDTTVTPMPTAKTLPVHGNVLVNLVMMAMEMTTKLMLAKT